LKASFSSSSCSASSAFVAGFFEPFAATPPGPSLAERDSDDAPPAAAEEPRESFDDCGGRR
jgi:hypothetical protein